MAQKEMWVYLIRFEKKVGDAIEHGYHQGVIVSDSIEEVMSEAAQSAATFFYPAAVGWKLAAQTARPIPHETIEQAAKEILGADIGSDVDAGEVG